MGGVRLCRIRQLFCALPTAAHPSPSSAFLPLLTRDPKQETAASVLRLYAYPDHAFLTAAFPLHRLHLHVGRLCRAGHKARRRPLASLPCPASLSPFPPPAAPRLTLASSISAPALGGKHA